MKYATFRQSQTLASNAFIEAFSQLVPWTLRIGSSSEQLQALTSRKAQRLSERKHIPNTMASRIQRESDSELCPLVKESLYRIVDLTLSLDTGTPRWRGPISVNGKGSR